MNRRHNFVKNLSEGKGKDFMSKYFIGKAFVTFDTE